MTIEVLLLLLSVAERQIYSKIQIAETRGEEKTIDLYRY